MEYPPEIETRDLWIAAVKRAGGDPFIGRKLNSLLSASGFAARIELLPRLIPPAQERFELLKTLPLSEEELRKLSEIERLNNAEEKGSQLVCHLPYYLAVADLSMVE